MSSQSKSPMALRIEERMRDLGIKTVVEASDKTTVSRAVITNLLLNPDKSVMTETAILLAKGLQCRVEWFITGTGPKTDADERRTQKLQVSAPVITLNELNCDNLETFIDTVFDDESRERYSCATGNTRNTVAIRLDRDIDGFTRGGLLFFELGDKQCQSGKFVLAVTAKHTPPEIMTFTTAHGRQFLKSLSDDIPDDLRVIEIDDEMTILGTFKAFTIV